MTATQKLDAVLNQIGHQTVWSELRNLFTTTEKEELRTILRKLARDQYIDFLDGGTHLRPPDDEKGYSDKLTIQKNVEGQLFIEQGGYEGDRKRRDEESQRLLKLENAHTSLQTRLNTLTAWIAGGTIALVLVEVIKFILELCHK